MIFKIMAAFSDKKVANNAVIKEDIKAITKPQKTPNNTMKRKSRNNRVMKKALKNRDINSESTSFGALTPMSES